MGRTQVIERAFKSTIGSRQIHEAILLAENTKGDFSIFHAYGGRDVASPPMMQA